MVGAMIKQRSWGPCPDQYARILDIVRYERSIGRQQWKAIAEVRSYCRVRGIDTQGWHIDQALHFFTHTKGDDE